MHSYTISWISNLACNMFEFEALYREVGGGMILKGKLKYSERNKNSLPIEPGPP